MTEKRFTYTTRIISDKKAYRKDYILDKETLLNTEQIVAILNTQNDYINYVTKERNIAYNKLDKLNDENKTLKKENEYLRKELKWLNRKYIAFSEATDKRLKEMMR